MKKPFPHILLLFSLAGCGTSVEEPTPVAVEPEISFPVSETGTEEFWAEPSVIQVCEGELGIARIHWNVQEVSRIEIRVEHPEGNLFVIEGPRGSSETGEWVRDGMVFCLLNADTRDLIRAIRVRVTREGCEDRSEDETDRDS